MDQESMKFFENLFRWAGGGDGPALRPGEGPSRSAGEHAGAARQTAGCRRAGYRQAIAGLSEWVGKAYADYLRVLAELKGRIEKLKRPVA